MKSALRFSKKIILPFLILLLGIYCSKGLFTYHFFSTHDGDHHLARSYEAIQALSEGHFPLRWAGKLNYFCGIPVFNFFYPLFYYLLFLFNLLFNDVILSLKAICILSFTVAPLFFFFWLKNETKNSLSAFLGAIFYLFVPYRFLLVFVRFSPEFVAYTILPIFLYFLSLFEKKLKQKEKGALLYGFGAALSGAALIVGHHLVAFLLFPILAIWFLIKFWPIFSSKDKKRTALIFLVVLSIFGLSAFFWGPVFLEIDEVKLSQLKTVNYQEHFPTLRQLIRSRWDYFYSMAGVENDGMSFMLGYAQWLMLGLAAISIFLWLIKKNFKESERKIILFWFLTSCLAIFLMLKPSIFIWESIPLLQSIQFPWRILGITSFTVASLAGFWLSQIKNKKIALAFFLLLSLLAIYGNRNHLLPQPLDLPGRYLNFEINHEHRYSTTTFGDDIINREAKRACSFDDPFLLIDDKEVPYNLERGNSLGTVKFEWPEEKEAAIRLNLEYFPNIYYLKLNGEEIDQIENQQGRLRLSNVPLKKGENILSWRIVQSPTEKIFNAISLINLIIWLVLLATNYFFSLGKDKTERSILLLLVLFFSFLRFYQLPQRTGFNWDQQRDAFEVQKILSGDLSLIGPRVLGPQGFFLGPYFYYLLAPFYFFTGGHPRAIIYFLVALNLVFFFVSYLVIKNIWGKRAALVFLFLWAINPAAIETTAWNPALIPLMIILIWYALFKKSYFWLGLLLSLAINFHFQAIFLIPFVFLFLFWQKELAGKNLLKAALGFFLPFTPLLLFDLKHNFLNFNLLKQFILGRGEGGNFFAWPPVATNFLSGFWGQKEIWLPLTFALILLNLWLIKKRKTSFDKNFFKSLFWLYPIVLLGFSFYGQRPSEYYFNFLLPFFILILTLFLISGSRLRRLFFVLLLVFLWLPKAIQKTAPVMANLNEKDKAIAYLAAQSSKNKVEVRYQASLGDEAGFDYFLNYYGLEKTNEGERKIWRISIPPEEKSQTFGSVGVKLIGEEGR